ncbi:MAG: hypothetical protein KDA28_01350, partial [Phycisphaerales bacterium]|nr:hypothetical protein [Phycisphaerales bacterium]
MHAHLVQMNLAWEDREANVVRCRTLLEGRTTPGDLVVLPEMFDSGFSINTAVTADTGDRTLEFLRTLSSDLEVTIQGSRTRVESGMGLNTAPVLDSGRLRCEYVKIHPFPKEAETFRPGTDVLTYDWNGLTVSPSICYDLRFPDVFRRGLDQGAEVLALGANWPCARQHHWRALLIARAIENQAFMLGVNRTGDDPYLHYDGGTIAIDPKGEILGELFNLCGGQIARNDDYR